MSSTFLNVYLRYVCMYDVCLERGRVGERKRNQSSICWLTSLIPAASRPEAGERHRVDPAAGVITASSQGAC